MKTDTTWTLVLLCGCMWFWSDGSGSSLSHKTTSFRLTELSQHLQYRGIVRDLNPSIFGLDESNATSNSSTSPFLKPWIKCPILDQLLEEYMSGFPEVDYAIDSFQISDLALNATLRRVADSFFYIQTPGLTEDLLIHDLARIILENRVNCTVTMYQRVFIYAMEKRAEVMMAPHDGSLLSDLMKVLEKYFPNKPSVLHLAPEIVRGVHNLVFQGMIDILQRGEFRYLDWYLDFIRNSLQAFFIANKNPTSDDLFNSMALALHNYNSFLPEVWQCTPVNDLIGIHKMEASLFSDHFFKMLRTGYVSAIVVGHINLLFRQPGYGLTSHTDMDDPNVDLAVHELERIIVNYAAVAMNKTADYVQTLSVHGVTGPPQDILDVLSPSEVADTWTLFSQIFGPTPSPSPLERSISKKLGHEVPIMEGWKNHPGISSLITT